MVVVNKYSDEISEPPETRRLRCTPAGNASTLRVPHFREREEKQDKKQKKNPTFQTWIWKAISKLGTQPSECRMRRLTSEIFPNLESLRTSPKINISLFIARLHKGARYGFFSAETARLKDKPPNVIRYLILPTRKKGL